MILPRDRREDPLLRGRAGRGRGPGRGPSLPEGEPTVALAVSTIGERHGDKLGKVLAASSFLLDGVAVRDTSTRAPAGRSGWTCCRRSRVAEACVPTTGAR